VKTLALIPARGGSKGVPRKNLRLLRGKSLVQRAYECAVAAACLDRIILSTEDVAIAAAARDLGLEVPFLRPPELATDEAPMIDVALHALATLRHEGYRPDALLLLQPTSPLRRPAQIREAVSLLGDNDAVCSVAALPGTFCPHYVMQIDASGFLAHFLPDGGRYRRRQDAPPAYVREGSIYLTRVAVLERERSFYGRRCVPLIVPFEEMLSIDTTADWEEAERRLQAREACRLVEVAG
jgi:CMP-N,N'-diacetyllegionaminic acid synthase